MTSYLRPPSRAVGAVYALLFSHRRKPRHLHTNCQNLSRTQDISLLRTCIDLLSSMAATPCLFAGRLSRESRTRSGKHAENAAKTPRWPLHETCTMPSDFWASNGSICTKIVLLNASAIFKFCWDALGRTIRNCSFITN